MADALLLFLSCDADRRRARSGRRQGRQGRRLQERTFVEAGKRLRELAALEPFQPGYLTTKYAESTGIFGDGKAAMELMGEWFIGHAGAKLGERQGPAGRRHRHLLLPDRAGRQRQGDRHARRRQRLPRHQDARLKEAVDFLNFFSQEKYAKEAAEKGGYIPAYKGSDAWVKDPLVRQVAAELAATTYHQNFFDQDLGPSVGRVINDVSVAVAAGQTTPEAAAAAIQDAWDQQ